MRHFHAMGMVAHAKMPSHLPLNLHFQIDKSKTPTQQLLRALVDPQSRLSLMTQQK
jgi:hypothetical protein